MLFVEAINKTITQSNEKKLLARNKYRPASHHHDSVELSSAAHEVKEIYLSSEEKTTLSAASSIFANIIEHVLNHCFNTITHLHSPEEINVDIKDWVLFLQVPPLANNNHSGSNQPSPQNAYKPTSKKSLIFHIPVKPFYGTAINMTLMMSSHQGSPKTPSCFDHLPKESQLSTLHTPYPPEFLSQQTQHYHIFIDQDGEPDQLNPLYSLVNQSRLLDESLFSEETFGLRIWRAKNGTLIPAALGDRQIGLLFVEHYLPLSGNANNQEMASGQVNNLYTKA
ncbi:hypothetical protein [Marinomonas algarum]|uniref:Uncharacterized protein n=1 Tax=Marinomonas algarum TaxID=2883105 RepID=A0A9X1IKU9_9GAMM|nr:hypothetical protein [Marinomonas algarum]MCB5161060.1 hypothetical protein [Marinomonas algarum]